MLRRLALLFLLLPSAIFAQSAPRSILVLDGSGSMWGQIDGVNKIVIAREVIGDLLQSLPEDLELGLMSYGHRRKGDCSDIEMLIAPGTDRAAIAAAANAISPKGKTPLSAAVIEAAEALRYTEEAATVILVSDGIETCNLDPCAVGRELEQAGVGFTAHVIGFDVADPAALAQLQCLAEETGGQFRTAANADELAGALAEVVVAEPEPVEARLIFQATDGDGGPVIREGLAWTITTAEGPQLTGEAGPEPELLLTDTTGTATVIRLADEAVAEVSFTVPFEGGPQTIVLPLPEFLPPAEVTGPAEAPAGSRISVAWSGPNRTHDKIMIVAVGDTNDPHQDFAFTSEGSPVELRVATTPGSYELRYVMNDGNKVLATQTITVTDVAATLDAPASAPAGSELSVGWTGPDAERDYIAILPVGAHQRERISYAYTGNGNPARFEAPTAPGAYELVYVLNDNGDRAIARRPITIAPVTARLDAPARAMAGSEIEVGFTGPAGASDMIVLAPPEAPTGYNGETGYPRNGTPVTLTAPLEPGPWEIRYMLGGRHGEIIARVPLEIEMPTGTLDAPATAVAGSRIKVGFTGPAGNSEKIIIVRPGAPASAREETGYPRNGNPAEIRVPAEPGGWEIRYMLGGVYGHVLASQPLEVVSQ